MATTGMRRIGRLMSALTLAACVLGDAHAAHAQYRRSARDLQAEAQLRALIAQLNAATAVRRSQPVQGLPSYCPAFRGPFIAPNVRNAIPMNGACQTPQERAWINHGPITQAITNGHIASARRSMCEQARAARPYGPNGRINRGWYDTPTGPRMSACY